MIRLAIIVGLLLAMPGLGVRPVPAQSLPSREYQLKAVFLFNFALFVEWPAGAFATPDAPLVIGVLGEDPFGDYLDETVRGETVRNRPLLVRRYRRADEIAGCQILFVNPGRDETLESVLRSLKDGHILTVGEAEDFARRGGMIRFVTDRNRIRLHINLRAAEAADLKLSSRLLRPAQIVTAGSN
jgi:hypothetical protein